MSKCCIYQIRNTINNRRYIGSSKNVEKRFNEHRRMLKRGKHHTISLQNAWNKYGEENFSFEIIKKLENESFLLIEEQIEIDKYDFIKDLYNLNPIATKPPVFKGENGPKASVTNEKAKNIRKIYCEDNKMSQRKLAKLENISKQIIRNIVHNRTYVDENYTPKDSYKDKYRNHPKTHKSTKSKLKFESYIKFIEDSGNKLLTMFEEHEHRKPFKIKCLKCNDIFERRWEEYKKNQKCNKCSGFIRKHTNESFIKKAKEIHGDKYDYSKVNYINSSSKLEIICLEHGLFLQTSLHHLSGQGCKPCGYNKLSTENKDDLNNFIEKAKRIYGNKYDYSKVEYVRSKVKVEIICSKCLFKIYQTPNYHLLGKTKHDC